MIMIMIMIVNIIIVIIIIAIIFTIIIIVIVIITIIISIIVIIRDQSFDLVRREKVNNLTTHVYNVRNKGGVKELSLCTFFSGSILRNTVFLLIYLISISSVMLLWTALMLMAL